MSKIYPITLLLRIAFCVYVFCMVNPMSLDSGLTTPNAYQRTSEDS